MKHIIMLIAANLLLCLPMQAQNRTVTLKNNQGEKLQVIELHDTVVNGIQTTDTLSITTYDNPLICGWGREGSFQYILEQDNIQPKPPERPLQ